jgi:small subunit ribosomal protein S20
MPNIRANAKHARASLRRKARNVAKKTAIRQVEKSIRKLIAEKKTTEAAALLPKFNSVCARAAKTNAIHKNKASRKVSRITSLLKKSSLATS